MIPAAGLGAIDWSRPWLAPWRRRGEPLATRALEVGLVQALNAELGSAAIELHSGRLRFVDQRELPPGEAYEAFIAHERADPRQPA